METFEICEFYSRFDKHLAVWSDYEFDSLLVFVFCLCGGKFLTSFDGCRILRNIGINWGIGYCENNFANFSKVIGDMFYFCLGYYLWYVLLLLPQDFLDNFPQVLVAVLFS